MYYWIWNNLALYSFTPSLAGTLIYTYLHYLPLRADTTDADSSLSNQ